MTTSTAAGSGAFDPATARIVATIEARMTSSRLPGKILQPVGGVLMLQMMIERLLASQTLSGVCVATTVNRDDDPVEALAAELGVDCWRGSEDDVLLRVLEAARHVGADVIVETTGDCPMIDAGLLDGVVAAYFAGDVHYCANNRTEGLPRGLDVQVFSTSVLDEVNRVTDDVADHEHVSLYIYEHPEQYSLRGVPAIGSLHRPDWRWTVDTADDLRFVRTVVDALGRDFTAIEAGRWLDEHPEVVAINGYVQQKPVR